MVKRALLLVLLAGDSTLLTTGCCGAELEPPRSGPTPTDRALQEIRGTLAAARTVRIRIQGEWPHAIARMPRGVTGTVLLGEGGRAKVSLVSRYAGGGSQIYEAIFDGTTLWRSPMVQLAGFKPVSGSLHKELLMALAWYGIGWSFPQGPHPKTLGEGWVICDLLPQERDRYASHWERYDGAVRTISHESPSVEYRLHLSYDPATHHLRKRELIGDKHVVWYIESYPEIVLNAAIPDEEFKIPGE